MRRTHLTQRIKNKWTILSLIALAIALGAGMYYHNANRSSGEQSVAQTSTITTGDIILSATGPGTLVPGQEVSFGFRNNGEVSEVLVSLGDHVEAGQILARQDRGTLELQYKQAAGNLAALNSPAEIASAEQAVHDARESLATARDDLQYMIGPEMFVAEEGVAKAQGEVQLAKTALQGNESASSQQELAQAEAALAQAQNILTYAYKNYANSYTVQTFTYPIRNDQGTTVRRELIAPTDAELLGARAAYALAQADLSDAQNYLDVLRGDKTADEVPASSLNSFTEAKLAYDSAKAALDATDLTAPIGGTITSIDLNVGENPGTAAVVTISNTDQPYRLDAYLDETDWDKARVGYAATVTFDLLPEDSYSGTITQVYPALDDSSGTAMVRITVQLEGELGADLPAGSTANVDVTGGEALDAVLVPTSALKEVQPGAYVVYLMKNGTPLEQRVEIGLQDILYAEVRSGLEKGDVVLTDAATIE